jgi:hypothetical protein
VNLRQRLRKLERSPFFQHPPHPVDPLIRLVLRETSDQDLELLIRVVSDLEAGLCRPLSETESAAVAAYGAALELKSRAVRA